MQRRVIALSLAVMVTGPGATLAQPTVGHVVLTASDAAPGDAFGHAVAMSGDTLIVGAHGCSDRGADSGAAYVFVRDAAGTWAQRQKLLPAELLAGDHFGWSVAIDGDLAVVGAPYDDRTGAGTPEPGANRGAAYVFRRIAGAWFQQARLQPDRLAAGDQFGWSVAVSGGTVAVGAPTTTVNARGAAGAVYVFRSAASPGEWTMEAAVSANEDPWNWTRFGTAVAMAPGYDNRILTGAKEGSVYIVGEPRGYWWIPGPGYGSCQPPTVLAPGLGARFGGATDLAAAGSDPVVVSQCGWKMLTTTLFTRVAGDGGTSAFPGLVSDVYYRPSRLALSREGRAWQASPWLVIHLASLSGPPAFAGDLLHAGSEDGVGSAARFTQIVAIDEDESTGTAYVVDGCAVRSITRDLVVTTVAGNVSVCGTVVDGPVALARFGSPVDLDAADGVVYVADGTVVRRVTLASGQVTTIAGSASEAAHVDGPGAVARFRAARGVALGREGVYVADLRTLRRIAPDGSVTTLAGDPSASPTDEYHAVDGHGTTARLSPSRLVELQPGLLGFLDGEMVRTWSSTGEVRTLAGLPSGWPGPGSLAGYSVAITSTGSPAGDGRLTQAAGAPGAMPPLTDVVEGGAALVGSDQTLPYIGVPVSAAAPRMRGRYGAAVAFTGAGELAIGPANGCLRNTEEFCLYLPGDPVPPTGSPVILARQDTTGRWRQVLTLPGATPDRGYGSALASAGALLAVGSPQRDGTLVMGGARYPTAYTSGPGAAFVYDLTTLDTDGDSLPDRWEMDFNLDPTSALGDDGASGDPDHDGRTNAEEYAAHTHPRNDPTFTRYFAEGATSDFFETQISIANPGEAAAAIALRFSCTGGATSGTTLTVPARASRTVIVNDVPLLARAECATTLESDRLVVADRVMTWSRAERYGSHGERATAAPSPIWYLAEGATHSGFDLFYLILNPAPAPVDVKVSYLRPSGPPPEKTYTVGANSRFTIWVDEETFGTAGPLLANTDVSAAIETLDGTAILVERAMYLTRPGDAPFTAGHSAAGVTGPARQWFFAEGATGSYFDLFYLVANPFETTANVAVEFLLPLGVNH